LPSLTRFRSYSTTIASVSKLVLILQQVATFRPRWSNSRAVVAKPPWASCLVYRAPLRSPIGIYSPC
jgi:hypothetical protein